MAQRRMRARRRIGDKGGLRGAYRPHEDEADDGERREGEDDDLHIAFIATMQSHGKGRNRTAK